MDKKMTGIIAYITLIGWLVAFFAGDKEGAKFHLNQSLVIFLFSIVCSVLTVIPVVGWIVGFVGGIAGFVFWIMGLVAACKEEEKAVPLIGSIKIIK
ncbi:MULTISPECIES: DUF4870 domain-containing protein [Anaerotruncus]|jgi:uncharacterized membrane protein|uniref:DUF4870 domain-containing protein n=1 Tax=Anaerotruncus TaxID=244127 RepID=UPI000E47ECA4|nr:MULTISPECIES: DUF4870 domain-containing protein [Anaerotruncus]RGX56396.1 hypothetical protein DWV16_04860 [Anaerotruncus sp. AF02-27]